MELNFEEETITKSDNTLNAQLDIIDKYRDMCRFYVKLDLGLFAAGVTIFSLLKMDVENIFETTLRIKGLLIFLVLLTTLGLFYDFSLLEMWVFAKTKPLTNGVMRVVKSLTFLQVTVHILLVLFIAGFIFGSLDAKRNHKEKLEALFTLQYAIEKYEEKFKKYPSTLEEISERPYVKECVRKLDMKLIYYKRDKEKGYSLDYKLYPNENIIMTLNHELYLVNKEKKENEPREIESRLQE